MTRVLAGLLWTVLIAAPAHAQEPRDAFFGDRQLEPSEREAEALEVLATNRPSGPTGKPVLIGERHIQFVYGASLPTIICSPMHHCAIELRPGEHLRGAPVLSDDGWEITPRISGQPGSGREITHVFLKPFDVGLQATLSFTTNRGFYDFQIASDRKQWMARVSFSYPDDQSEQWTRFLAEHGPHSSVHNDHRPSSPHARPAAPRGAHETLSFAYRMEGDHPAWRPVRIYNDGIHTFIEFPPSISQMHLPALSAIRYEGGLLTDDEQQGVNYRQVGRFLKIDGVPNIMDLVSGVGTTQTKVRIYRTAEPE